MTSWPSCPRRRSALALLLTAVLSAPAARAGQAEPGAPQEAPPGAPLVTTLGTRAFDVEYELWYYVNVVFESEVDATDDGYAYRYRLTNKGDTRVQVEWRALEESAFAEAVDDPDTLRIGPLEPGAVSDWLVLTSRTPPRVDERAARMFGRAPSGNESVQFSGPAPAYVPE